MILFNMSIGCTLTKELENLNRNYYRFIHVNQNNENLNYVLKRKLNVCHY